MKTPQVEASSERSKIETGLGLAELGLSLDSTVCLGAGFMASLKLRLLGLVLAGLMRLFRLQRGQAL